MEGEGGNAAFLEIGRLANWVKRDIESRGITSLIHIHRFSGLTLLAVLRTSGLGGGWNAWAESYQNR